MRDRTGALTITLTCFVLTFCTACWSENFGLVLLFYILQVLSFLWLLSLFNGDPTNPGYQQCFNIGLGCTFLGVGMLLLPLVGLKLFQLFYILGTVCSLGSILLLMGPLKHWDSIHDKTKQMATNITHESLKMSKKTQVLTKMICQICSFMVLGTVFWNWGLALILNCFICFFFSSLRSCPAHVVHFTVCLTVGVGLTTLGVCMLFIPGFGFTPFSVFYTIGIVCIMGSPMFLVEPSTLLKMIFNTTSAETTAAILICSFMVLSTVFWNWGLALVLNCFIWIIFSSLRSCPAHVVHFTVCLIVGVGFTTLGMYMLFLAGIELNWTPFSVFYTFGIVCILGSIMFLVDPSQLLKMMFDEKRAGATAAILICLVLTLFSALWWKSFVLAWTFSFLHILSSIWYCLSYIPDARSA